MTLGQRIQQIRVIHALSQEELAERLGTTRQTVSRWELDAARPDLEKIVLISKLFSVTTDSILCHGISTFDTDIDSFPCGVYRSTRSETVVTEKFALVYDCSADKNLLGTRLYMGFCEKKRLVAVCRRDCGAKTTEYAYTTDDGTVITNSDALASSLGERYDSRATDRMRRLERFTVDHSASPLPRVSEIGICRCLTAWRMGAIRSATAESMHFTLCTGTTEYVFSVDVHDTNIYCGISYNEVFELGLYGGMQFFRIRNYRDNSEPFCSFYCDFSFERPSITVPTGRVSLGSQKTAGGMMWCVKRYTDDEIILDGCGGDEYPYRRSDRRDERYNRDA